MESMGIIHRFGNVSGLKHKFYRKLKKNLRYKVNEQLRDIVYNN